MVMLYRGLDQRKVKKIEPRATRLLLYLHDKSHTKRLVELKLCSLSQRRLRGDFILVFKILNGCFDYHFADLTKNLLDYNNQRPSTKIAQISFKVIVLIQ